ncbi:MAG: 23S rRNA (adenine(2503)-C(2))-methyltransferase RlmN [Actinobacteria bacterium]|nr:23S rRNA (adenine(2503)-C(2))-methyltransferase RlmN [Actinomycetota bacterium]
MNLNIENLKKIIKDEKAYRLMQLEQAIYRDLIEDWQNATSLPVSLREQLKKDFPLTLEATLIRTLSKNNNALKAAVTLSDGFAVETVLMRHKNSRNTVCVSSQIGCPLCCTFCRTGSLGFKRNLNDYEIINQVLFFARYLNKVAAARVTNVVFMGMGEPFLNYENVIRAIRLLNDKNKFNIGARKISISTCGIPDKILRFAGENLQVNLAVSLSAPNDDLRSKIMPINNKYPLKMVLEAVKKYIAATNRRVMFEYVIIGNLNDSPVLAVELSRLLKDILCFVNLIPYNGRGIFYPPSAARVKDFKRILEESGVSVTERYRFGRDISAACGQLIYNL